MGRQSKASIAHFGNILKASFKSYKATVKEASDLDSDSDSDDQDYTLGLETGNLNWNDVSDATETNNNGIQGRYFALAVKDDFESDSDLDSVSDSDDKGMELDDNNKEIRNDAALLAFNNVLQRAQEIAQEAEKKK